MSSSNPETEPGSPTLPTLSTFFTLLDPDWQRGQTFNPSKEKWEKEAIEAFEKIFYLIEEIDGYMYDLAKLGVHTAEGVDWYCSYGGKTDAPRLLVHDRMTKLMEEVGALESAMKRGKV